MLTKEEKRKIDQKLGSLKTAEEVRIFLDKMPVFSSMIDSESVTMN